MNNRYIPKNAVCAKCNRNHRIFVQSLVNEYATELLKNGKNMSYINFS